MLVNLNSIYKQKSNIYIESEVQFKENFNNETPSDFKANFSNETNFSGTDFSG